MSRHLLTRVALAAAIAAVLAYAPAARADYSEEQLKADLKLLDDAKVPHGDADLLDFFKKRLMSAETRARIEAMVEKFSSKSFKERQQAISDTIKVGPPALPVLRKVLQSNSELEVIQRAKDCIKEIEKKSPNAQVLAAARLIKHRRVAGAGAVLLEYLPVAPDTAVEEEVDASIYGLAMLGADLQVMPPVAKAGSLDPLLVKTLTDKEPARRAIAALVVGRYGDAAERRDVAKLLTDTDPTVRYRAAQGLACSRDAAGLPVLVELLDKGPMALALQAEDLLSLIADEKGPAAPLAEKAELRKKCHDAWKEWIDQNQGKIDLTKFDADSPFGGINERVTKGAIGFIKALLKYDTAMLTKVTDVPFTFVGQLIFQTREEFDNFVAMIKNQGGPPPDFKFRTGKIMPASEYVLNAQESERNFLEAARIAQVHIVYVTIEEGGGPQSLPFFMRISGGRARCIGIGLPKIGNQ
jgi:HEAT repeat protein